MKLPAGKSHSERSNHKEEKIGGWFIHQKKIADRERVAHKGGVKINYMGGG